MAVSTVARVQPGFHPGYIYFLSSEKFFASLGQTLLDETQHRLSGKVPASLKSDTGYEIFPANSDTDELAKERRGVWGFRGDSRGACTAPPKARFPQSCFCLESYPIADRDWKRGKARLLRG
jgi:hypothetical protein